MCAFYAIINQIIFPIILFKTFPESMEEILNCRIKSNKHEKRVRKNLEKRESKRPTKTNPKVNIHFMNHQLRTDMVNSINKSDQVYLRNISNVTDNVRRKVFIASHSGSRRKRIFIRLLQMHVASTIST
jgi:hypothetical protein